MEDLFIAAGAPLTYSVSYLRNFYTGYKNLTVDLKQPYRTKDNIASLTDFFFAAIDDAKTIDALITFNVPEKGEANKKALAVALAKQTKAIIDSDEVEVEDIIILEYQKAKETPDETASDDDDLRKLYQGDDIYVDFKPARTYKGGSREDIQHTWVLQNRGKITWTNRRLVYRRGSKDRPEANPSEIPIPVTKPNEFVHLNTVFNGRGFDAVTRCIWDMVDKDGENCFPNQDYLFCVTIDAKYKR